MRQIRTEFRINNTEKKLLTKMCQKYGLGCGDYIRRKLFDENDDLNLSEELYINPEIKKHNMISITMLYKIYYLLLNLLEKTNIDKETIAKIDQNALNHAREQREKHGYTVVKQDE